MGYLQDYNTQHNVTPQPTATTGGGGYYQQYLKTNPSANTVTASSTPQILTSTPQNGGLLSKVGNFIDNLFKPITKAPDVLSPVPGQNTNPVNKAPVQLAKDTFSQELPQTTNVIKNVIADPASLKSNPKQILSDVKNELTAPLQQEAVRIKQLFDQKPQTGAQRTGEALSTIAGAGNIVFSPLTALFKAANDIPVLGTVSKLLTLPFTAVGEEANSTSSFLVDLLPISKEAKDQLKPGIAEIAVLASQLALGKAIEGGKVKELTNKYGPEDAKTIVTEAQKVANEQIKEEGKTQNIYSPQDIQKEVLSSDLKGTPAGEALLKSSFEADRQGKQVQLKQSEEGLQTPSGTTFTHSIVDKPFLKNATPLDETTFSTTQKPVETEVKVAKNQLPVGEGEQKVSRLEARMKQALDIVSPEKRSELGLSTYEKMSKEDQIAKAADYVKNNKNEAIDVLKGIKEPPKGILPESIYVALTKVADEDVTLATKLASLSATRLGQRLSILTELDPHSPVKILNDIYKVREGEFQKRFKGKSIDKVRGSLLDEAQKQVKKPDKYDWNNFINSLAC